jgi:hypothetical protein
MGNTLDNQAQIAISAQNNPLLTYESFLTYIECLNQIIHRNMHFTRAFLNVNHLHVDLLKPQRNWISKMWVNKLMDSAVMVSYTIMPVV